jgi:drug/metabolite transporter (DMT)-like permease
MRTSLKADLAILSITVIWGSSFIIMKNIVEVLGVYAYLAMRFTVAAVILAVLFRKPMQAVQPRNLMHGGIIGILLFMGMALQVTGLKYTSASTSAFVTGLNVVIVPVVSALFLRKQPPVRAVIGVMMATAGLFVLTGGFSQHWNKGDTLTLLCSFCFAMQIIFIDKFNAVTDPKQTAVIQMVTAALLYGAAWLLFEPGKVNITWIVVVTVLYTGALGTAFAFGVQTIAQKYTSPTRTALIISCEPVFGAVFALLVPGTGGKTETLTWAMIAGSVLILGGMITAESKTGSGD